MIHSPPPHLFLRFSDVLVPQSTSVCTSSTGMRQMTLRCAMGFTIKTKGAFYGGNGNKHSDHGCLHLLGDCVHNTTGKGNKHSDHGCLHPETGDMIF